MFKIIYNLFKCNYEKDVKTVLNYCMYKDYTIIANVTFIAMNCLDYSPPYGLYFYTLFIHHATGVLMQT